MKKSVIPLREFLIVVTEDARAGPSTAAPGSVMDTLTIYDLPNKLNSFSAPLRNVKLVMTAWECVCVCCGDGRVFELREKDVQTKLDNLFKRNLWAF